MSWKNSMMDIRIAGGLGAGFGLSIAYAMGMPFWAHFVIPFVCGLMGAVFYRPEQIWNAVTGLVPACTPQNRASLASGTKTAASVMFFICIATVSMTGPLAFLMSHILPPAGGPGEHAFFSILAGLTLGLVSAMFGIPYGGMYLDLYARVRKNKKTEAFPVCRRLPKKILLPTLLYQSAFSNYRKWTHTSLLHKIALTTVFIPVMQLWSIVIVTLWVSDIVLSIIIICACTERMAAASGGFLGGLTGIFLSLSGMASSPQMIIGGGIVMGFMSSGYIYTFALQLRAPVLRTQHAPA